MKKQNPKPVELTLDKGFKDIYHRCKDLCNHCKKHKPTYINIFCFGLTISLGWPLYTFLLKVLSLTIQTLNKAIENGMSDTFELLILTITIFLILMIGKLFLRFINTLKGSIKDLSEDVSK